MRLTQVQHKMVQDADGPEKASLDDYDEKRKTVEYNRGQTHRVVIRKFFRGK